MHSRRRGTTPAGDAGAFHAALALGWHFGRDSVTEDSHAGSQLIWNPVPVHKSPFLSSACHMPVIRSPFSYLWSICQYPCDIFVINKLEKDIPGIYQSVLNLKKICQTSKRCTRYIPSVSFQVQNCMLSYALHIPVINFSGSAECSQQMKFSRESNRSSISAYYDHGTAFVMNNKIYLLPVHPLAPCQ